MKLFLKIFLLISSVFGLISCSPIKGFRRAEVEPIYLLSRGSVVDSTVAKNVYKAKIDVFGNYFSGLFLIKYIPIDSSYRVVLLSEVGLNLLDMKYKNNEFSVVSCQEFLNKKMLLNTMQSDFELLFLSLNDARKTKTYKMNNNDEHAIRFRHNWDKFYYFWRENNDYYRIFKKEFFYGSVNLLIRYDQQQQIEEMNFKHKGIKLEMNLLRLNKNE